LFRKKKHINQLSDEDIVALYQQKFRKKYIGVLYERYYHLVFGVCLKYLKNVEESKDAVATIFEKLLEDLKTVELTKFRAWLYVVSKNYCLQQLRKNKNINLSINEVEYTLQEEDLKPVLEEKELLLRKMEEQLKHLKKEQRECIELFYLKNKSYTQIVAQTGYNLKQVKSYIQNGKRNLKINMTKKS